MEIVNQVLCLVATLEMLVKKQVHIYRIIMENKEEIVLQIFLTHLYLNSFKYKIE
jgi:hypothetical protein